MSSLTLPLAEMSLAEKLTLLDLDWADLQRSPESLPSPAWHQDVLVQRRGNAESGNSDFSAWNETFQRIRDRTT